jgi:deazaflavin-dependent oxidoreductase (nitroreductase family)
MSERKRQVMTRIYRVVNPVNRKLAKYIPGQAVIETIGRRSGLPRRNPVGGRLADGSFWIVTEHGRKADYVRNAEANPRVRVQLRGEWHTGTAHLLDDDDPKARLRRLPAYNSAMVWLAGTDLLTMRIDLD